ncbi:MAG TPA: esterase-like activity of phytase family protein [Acetobacteraceae bacterium]|nr:esterase-like activity of phytase family protein [Acetobacteraceae bacterium]
MPRDGMLRVLGALDGVDAAIGFGGISAAHLAPDLTLTVVSDLTQQGQMRLVLDPSLRPVALERLSAGPLRDGGGRPLARGHAGDAEALARRPDGTWLVGFERWHRIRAYADLDGPGVYAEAPPGLDLAPGNGGLEALTTLADGRLLALAEELEPSPGLRAGWLGGGGRWEGLTYRPATGFVPTDAAGLPDGGALVLERSFSLFAGFAGRVVRLPPAAIRPGAVLEGEELLRLDEGPLAENWEAVAVTVHQGRQLVAMLTDNNENRLQRSLLLLAELAG